MNAGQQPELNSEVEFLEILKRACRTTRQSRTRPDLAIPAAEWEMRINDRLDELHRLETPALPLNSHKPKAVAA